MERLRQHLNSKWNIKLLQSNQEGFVYNEGNAMVREVGEIFLRLEFQKL